MALTKYKLGDLMIPFSKACGIPDLDENQVSGVNKEKEFFEARKIKGRGIICRLKIKNIDSPYTIDKKKKIVVLLYYNRR